MGTRTEVVRTFCCYRCDTTAETRVRVPWSPGPGSFAKQVVIPPPGGPNGWKSIHLPSGWDRFRLWAESGLGEDGKGLFCSECVRGIRQAASKPEKED